jgi:hypothetical protein
LVWNLGSRRVLHLKYGAPDEISVTFRRVHLGNVLNTIMYIVYTAQLGGNLPPGCRIIESADDVCLFSSLVMLEAAIRVTEEGINTVDETLQTLGLEISQKTELMLFSPNN